MKTMRYYAVFGRNGVVVKPNYGSAMQCKKYLPHSNIISYLTFAEAEYAALLHLRKITPMDCGIPHSLKLNQMETVNKQIERQHAVQKPAPTYADFERKYSGGPSQEDYEADLKVDPHFWDTPGDIPSSGSSEEELDALIRANPDFLIDPSPFSTSKPSVEELCLIEHQEIGCNIKSKNRR